jgi:S-adenosyl-L-methionine hydrolase (adenosine-forming)
MPSAVITLTTDFGWTELPSAMRGVIRQMAPPGTEVVDINHSIPPQNIVQGAYAMLTVCPIYKGAIHIGVVDPGVGTKRRAVAIETEGGTLVGPDNGLLAPLAHRLVMRRAFVLTNPKYWRVPVSATFHGRDIFAPVSAHLASGVPLESMGKEAGDLTTLPAFEVHDSPADIRGFVVNIDPFGNLVTSIPGSMAVDLLESGKRIEGRIAGKRVHLHPVSAYGEIAGKAFGVIANSSDFLEVAVHNGSAVERLGAQTGDPVVLRK